MLYNIYNIDECIYLPIAIVLALIILVICSFHFYKKKKIALNTILSIWSICLSAIAFITAFLRVDVYFTNDSFVGIMAGFMGACATILVGVQIYNSIDTRNSINKLNESFEKKIQELNSNHESQMKELIVLTNKLDYDFKQSQKDIKESNSRIKNQIKFAGAVAFFYTQPFSSYKLFYECLQFMLKNQDEDGTSTILGNLESIVNRLKSGNISSLKDIDKIASLDFNNLKSYHLSSLIEDRYNKIHSDIMEIIKNKI
ncbi:hypothetical protein DWZ34_10870 [Phocaeicola plebeius]|uniref:Uncharacterized protein n=1 Tax=Phocaeicola plebeius TaxID=310297 RepID=A0A415T340_9BACT|nr:hypothetical protein [Phocaeicola plebeius]RHM95721.1 hypothetical protein DWZ34_10870 [Phocaeicola plebeius]